MRSDEEAARGLLIDILLEEKKEGWAGLASTDRMREFFPESPENDLELMARRVGREAWAYRDELEAKPMAELQKLATAVTERQAEQRKKAQRERQQEVQQAMFARWARKSYWTPDESVLLVFGDDPATLASRVFTDEEYAEREDVEDLLSRAISDGEIKQPLRPVGVLAWFKQKGVDVPAELVGAVAELPPAKALTKEPAESSPAKPSFDIEGYDCPPELGVMLEAIRSFWVNADRSRPPKKDEIIKTIRKAVDTDAKANAIDLLIRPEWARVGGNKKRAKG